MDIMPLMSLQSNKKYPPNPLESRVLHDFPCKKRFKGAKSVVQIKPAVIARCQACCHCEARSAEAIHAGPSPVIASRKAKQSSAVLSRMSLRGTKCRSNPAHTSPENGLPRFLTEPRNDRGRCQACCHCEPQGEAIQCRSRQRLDCRGSLRNLAMTAWMRCALDCRGSLRNLAMTSLPRSVHKIAAVPYGISQ